MTKEEKRKFIDENINSDRKALDELKIGIQVLMCGFIMERGLALKCGLKYNEMLDVTVKIIKGKIDKAAEEIIEEGDALGIREDF